MESGYIVGSVYCREPCKIGREQANLKAEIFVFEVLLITHLNILGQREI